MADTDLSRTPKDASSSSFLSKITRSPSRKHKTQPSIPTPGIETPFLGSNSSQAGSLSKRTYPRPGFQRAPTAPAAPISLKPTRSDLSEASVASEGDSPQSVVTSSHLAALSGSNVTKTHPMASSKSAEPVVSSVQNATIAANVPQSTSATGGSQNPNSLYQHIHDMSNKRIATLNYMRKTHEGRIHWFNTMHFTKADISKLPAYTPNRLSRRATNYFILGLSIPAVLDVHSQPHPQSAVSTYTSAAQDFLRSLNNLLTEFDSFQQLHPSDGSSASSLSRARIPQMFKRATQNTGKPRRTSGTGVTDIGLPMQQTAISPPGEPQHGHSNTPSTDTTNTGTTFSSSAPTLVNQSPSITSPTTSFPLSSSFPSSSPFEAHANTTLLPSEGPYSHLLTPPLPFAPDFYCVFATLCDVLIDAYQRLLQLISSPAVCTVGLGELFAKADARLRKLIVGGVVRDFEGATREGARRELIGVQRVVLGGLMGS